MIKVDTFLIWFFMPIFVGCATYKIETNTPAFLDPVRGYGRVYKAEKVEPNQCGDPNYKFVFSGQTIPINEMTGFVCLPADQVQYNLRFYNDYLKKKANCQ